jgi:putative transposase
MISVLVSLFLKLRNTARSRAALQLEVLALRHQLQVLERSRRCRPRLSRADRLLWVWLSHAWPDWRTALVIVKRRRSSLGTDEAFGLFWR